MKKILITGGAGYIGSYLCTMLVEMGHKVTVIDLLKYSTTSLNHLFMYKNGKLTFVWSNIQLNPTRLFTRHISFRYNMFMIFDLGKI